MASIISTKTSGGGGIAVTGDTSGVMQLASNNGTTAVTIDASQNVGIGTASPSFKFQVNDNSGALVRPTASGTTNQVDWHVANSGGDAYFGIDNNSGLITGTAYGAYLYNGSNTPLTFHTNTIKRMTIDQNGIITSTLGGMQLLSGTAVATTSGTAKDFTSIPSWVKRITIMFNAVSLSGSANLLIQIGTGGTPTTSGYSSTSSYALASSSQSGGVSSTAGYIMYIVSSSYIFSGHIVLTNISGNTWVSSGLISNVTTIPYTGQTAGTGTISSTLDMVRITTSNGTDAFDAGSVNILYE